MTVESPRSRVALVTGGAGTIGAAVVERLRQDGLVVASADAGHEHEPDAGRYRLDVRDDAACAEVVEDVVDRFGGLDVLVNAAGIMRRGTLVDLGVEQWREVLAVNLDGTAFMCRAAYRHLSWGDHPSVVNLASTHALRVTPGTAAYGVSKAAVIQLTKVLAREWGGDGIAVNAVAPTLVPSPMNADIRADESRYAAKLASIPMGRDATVDDVASVVSFLAAPPSQFVTGQTFAIDGGETL